MEQNTSISSETPQISSFMTRASNVFMAPAELYTEVAATPVQTTSWVIPYILAIVVGILMTFALFSNQTLQDQIMQPQRDAIQKQVAEGKMTQEQADQAESFMKPGMFLAFGIGGTIVIVTATLFFVPLVLLLASKVILQYSGTYKKLLEVYGLSFFIGLLGTLISLLMMYSMDSMYAQPGPVFFIKDSFENGNFVHNLLASLGVFSIWQTSVVGIGMSKVTGQPAGKSMAVVFGLWIIYIVCASLLGWGK